MISISELIKHTSRDIDVCWRTTGASIRDREIHASLLPSLLVEARGTNLLAA